MKTCHQLKYMSHKAWSASQYLTIYQGFLKNNLPWRQEKCYEQYEMFWHRDLPPWHCVSHFHQSLIASSHYFSRTITTFLGFNGIQHYQQKRMNSVKIQWLFLILARAQKQFQIIAFHTHSIGRHKKEKKKDVWHVMNYYYVEEYELYNCLELHLYGSARQR